MVLCIFFLHQTVKLHGYRISKSINLTLLLMYVQVVIVYFFYALENQRKCIFFLHILVFSLAVFEDVRLTLAELYYQNLVYRQILC